MNSGVIRAEAAVRPRAGRAREMGNLTESADSIRYRSTALVFDFITFNPFYASRSKLLLFEGFNATLV